MSITAVRTACGMNADGQKTNAQCEHDAERDRINVLHSRVYRHSDNLGVSDAMAY
jgi:hypothetical protein